MKKSKNKNKNDETKEVEVNEDQLVHPSIDFKDDNFLFGFRIIKLVDTDEGKVQRETNVYLIASSDKKIRYVEQPESFEVGDKVYHFDTRARTLEKISKKWDSAEVKKLFEKSNDELYKTNSLEVFNQISDQLKGHIELENPADYTLLTAWIIGTYLFPVFSTYPYLHIKAPKGSGKSQTLSFIALTAFNAVKARASLPAFRDTSDSLRGAFLMDQADCLHRQPMEEILDIMTDSYKKGGGETRKMEKTSGGNWKVAEFQTFCPKAFASIYPLPEDLRDRCIVVPLIKSKRNLKYLNEDSSIWKEIRSSLYKLAILEFSIFHVNYFVKKIEYEKDESLTGRKLELWLPLEAILQSIGVSAEIIESAKARVISQYNVSESPVSDFEIEVIEYLISELSVTHEKILSPKDIAENIKAEMFDFTTTKQKATEVGKVINKFNLHTKKLPRSRKGERYLFNKEKVEELFATYVGLDSDKEDAPPAQIHRDESDEPIQSPF